MMIRMPCGDLHGPVAALTHDSYFQHISQGLRIFRRGLRTAGRGTRRSFPPFPPPITGCSVPVHAILICAGVLLWRACVPNGSELNCFLLINWLARELLDVRWFPLMNHSAVNTEVSTVPYAISIDRSMWFQAGLLVLLVGFLYHSILASLVSQWWDDPNFSHGFFVPLFSAFVVWQERKSLAAVTPKPSWFGLVIMAGALAVLMIGVLGVELFLSRSSLVFLLAGLIVYFMGWGYFRRVLFPWACLFLMIPIPAIVFNQIAFPLQLVASRFASSLLPLLGVPVLQEGNVLQLPVMSLEVAQACSGIRSLMSLGTLAIMYGYFLEPKIWRRVLLALAAVPIAIVANGLRVLVTGLLVQYWDPAKAEGFFHEFQGWVIFVLSLLLLFSVHWLMRLFDRLRVGRPA
jgi:exosortase